MKTKEKRKRFWSANLHENKFPSVMMMWNVDERNNRDKNKLNPQYELISAT